MVNCWIDTSKITASELDAKGSSRRYHKWDHVVPLLETFYWILTLLRGHACERDLQVPWCAGPCLHSSLISHQPLIPRRLPAPVRFEVVLWCLAHTPCRLCALFPLLDPWQAPSSMLSFHSMTPYIILHSPELKLAFLFPFLHKNNLRVASMSVWFIVIPRTLYCAWCITSSK